MTFAERMADFVVGASFEDLSQEALLQLKIRVLDGLACALGALGGEPLRMIREQMGDFAEGGRCTLIGGGRAAPDRAALYNSALVRYLDFNDSYLARGETCHPSDNLGAVMAAVEHQGGSGKDLLLALAVAYQVQCRLSDMAPVRAKGFDHTTQMAYSVAAGVSKALGLDQRRTANALAICGTALNALRVSRTGALSHWKGLAAPNTAFCATHGTFLAMRGITGPLEVFEGNKGFMDSVAGCFDIDWGRENLERVRRTIIKRYNAEIHSQSTLEGLLELKAQYGFGADDVERVEVETFDVAYNIIGGGEEGSKRVVRTKEEADHSLPYLVAVALLDGQVMPEQYRPERINRQDVQDLLRRVSVRPVEAFSRQFPEGVPCRVRVILRQGGALVREKGDYEGFFTNPVGWDRVVQKLHGLAKGTDPSLLRETVDALAHLETLSVAHLMEILAKTKAS